MKTKRFDFNFRPLQINLSITVDGTVPDSQSYDADEDVFTPDYTVTPCAIMPAVSRIDREGILSSGPVNGDDAHFLFKWSELKDGKEVEIPDSDTGYKITRSGNSAGRILIKKNAKPQVPLNLVFYCEYIDPRDNQIYRFKRPYQIFCRNETVYIPQLFLDVPDQLIYNPLADPDKRTIHASLRLGTKECDTSKRIFVWEVYREDTGVWAVPGTDESDYDIEVSADGTSATVDCTLMGDGMILRCRAKYDRDGSPQNVTLDNSAPCKMVRFVRRIPKLDYDFGGAPTRLPSGTMEIRLEASIRDSNGSIDNPERYLLPVWSVATNTTGTLSYTKIATGLSPIVSTSPISASSGAVYGLDVVDVGPIAVMLDSDDSAFVDPDGNYLTIK